MTMEETILHVSNYAEKKKGYTLPKWVLENATSNISNISFSVGNLASSGPLGSTNVFVQV